MLFSSASFLLFFFSFLLVLYFCVPKRFRSLRNGILLIFSLVFYACGGPKFFPLLLSSIFVNYVGGLAVSSENPTVRRSGLCLAVAANLGLLGWFKYAGFFSGILNSVIPQVPILAVTLPIGISFFTFQGMSYVIDVYRRDTPVQRNPLWLALYISLFPQLIAGPIVRYATIADEISQRDENIDEFASGCVRFMLGFGKKMILANAAAEIAEAVFSLPDGGRTVSLAWVGALAYTAQIYFDFSAYSDMAIGMGHMFGFHFLENFNYPYISQSVTEFWRRWHISLSTWFRDYVYIPLGGSRCATWKRVRNILIVWFLTGMWHGAAWNFILWGLFFALLLLGEKYVWGAALSRAPRVLRHIYTMLSVIISWVLFRAETLPAVWSYLGAMFGMTSTGLVDGQTVYYLLQYWPEWILFVLCSLPLTNVVKEKLLARPDSAAARMALVWVPKLFALAVFFLGYVELVSGSFNPFIYSNF